MCENLSTQGSKIDLETKEGAMSVVKSRRLQEQLEQLRLGAEKDHVKQEQSILFQIPGEIRNTSKETLIFRYISAWHLGTLPTKHFARPTKDINIALPLSEHQLIFYCNH